MANIQNYLNQIKTAVFGKDVRESIHDAIKQCYDDASINHDNANMEVKLARGSHNTLNDRLDENEKNQENLSSQLDTMTRKTTISVTDFGAKGDGINDDTLSFNNAIDYINSLTEEAYLFIPRGCYVITSTLNKLNDFKSVYGEYGSIILHQFNGDLFIINGRKNKFINFEIRGKSIYSSDFESYNLQNAICSNDKNVYDCEIINMKISCGNSAIHMNFKNGGYFFNNIIDKCNLSDNGCYSVYLKAPNSWSWIHCNTFRNTKMESNGKGGILIEGWESSQNNKFENLIMDNNGSQYKVETDERFGIYDNTSIYFYNNIYDNIYFENIKVPANHNIDSNEKVGALIIDNDFDNFTIKPCVFSNNTRNIFLRIGGKNLLSNKVGTCEIKQGLIGNSDTSINQKAFIEIKGIAPKTLFTDIVKAYGDIKKYDIPDDFNGKIINQYEKIRSFYRQTVTATHNLFLAKIDTTTKKGIFNNSVKITSYFNHNNNYNQLSMYSEHILLATGNTVSVKKITSFANYTINFKFFTYQNAIYMLVYILNKEAYPLLNISFDGCINLANVEEIQYSKLFDGFNVDGSPILKPGVNEVPVS